jgi:hypothetical protein
VLATDVERATHPVVSRHSISHPIDFQQAVATHPLQRGQTMKLARIEHWRCGEPISWKSGSGSTYVWVPDEMLAEELDSFCDQAQKSYLDTEKEFRDAAPAPPPGYGATIKPNTPDTKTVGELRTEYETQTKDYKEYQALLEKSRKPFAWHLNMVSGGTIIQFWELVADLEVEVDWGHNHGVTIEHSPTSLGDFPFPKDEDDSDL